MTGFCRGWPLSVQVSVAVAVPVPTFWHVRWAVRFSDGAAWTAVESRVTARTEATASKVRISRRRMVDVAWCRPFSQLTGNPLGDHALVWPRRQWGPPPAFYAPPDACPP